MYINPIDLIDVSNIGECYISFQIKYNFFDRLIAGFRNGFFFYNYRSRLPCVNVLINKVLEKNILLRLIFVLIMHFIALYSRPLRDVA